MKKVLSLILVLALFANTMVFATGASELASKKEAITLDWWDQYMTLESTHQKIFDEYEAETGNHVAYQGYEGSSFKEALDLAIRSGQSPDIFSNIWGTNNIVQKYHEGVLAPMTIKIEDLPEYIQSELYEGFCIFDGEVYSFPTQAKNHSALLWYDNEKVNEEDIPATLSELREFFKSITDPSKNQYAIALPMADASRINKNICYVIAASGGFREMNPNTGYYEYDSDIAKAVMKWFIDIYQDGSVHPASTTLKTKTVRERFVNGEAVFAMDGVWYPGSIKTAFGTDPLPRLGVVGTPVLDAELAEEKGMIGTNPLSGTFYISSSCEDPEAATQLLLKLLDDQYSIDMAAAMDQPPVKTEAIAKADVVDVYAEACAINESEMGYYPNPLIRNPETGNVTAEMNTIKPDLGDIFIGYVTGGITDWEKAMEEYNAKMNAELDRAIAECKAQGINVDHSDYVFPNFVPGQSYTLDKYSEL
ncbi:MAG: carbohydrate ABC transporter substrate-binding protein [Sphaerochaetaceae bacterium]|nr:carbohydrate ABC transporter substrate-binding protein [Sphaerochaetaceae bacterium]